MVMGSASDALAPAPADVAPSEVAADAARPFRTRLAVAVPAPEASPPVAPARRWGISDVPLPRPRGRSFDLDTARRTTALSTSLREDVAGHRFPIRVLPKAPASPDPLGDAFVGNWEQQHVPKDRFVPLTGTLDLSALPMGTFYGRAWGLDEDLRGLGFGMAWHLRDAWDFGAEVGIDPFSKLEEGRIAFLFGVSRNL